jgi:hypothetical protein
MVFSYMEQSDVRRLNPIQPLIADLALLKGKVAVRSAPQCARICKEIVTNSRCLLKCTTAAPHPPLAL